MAGQWIKGEKSFADTARQISIIGVGQNVRGF
jgi:hypothetical protein